MGGAGEDALVVLLVEGDDARGAEVILSGFAGGGGHAVEAKWIVEKADGGVGHGVDIADGEEEAVAGGAVLPIAVAGISATWIAITWIAGAGIVDEFGNTAYAGGDGGDAAGHGFEGGEAEGFHLGGHDEEVGEGEKLVDVLLFAEEVDVVANTEASGEVFGGGAVGAVADEHKAGRHGAGDAGKDFDNVGDTLDGAEV